MNRKGFSTALAMVLAAGSAQADFSYEQTSKITGGMMAGMMKFAGAFSKQAREPMRSTVTIKGDRMTTTSANRLSIIDLAAETMTEVDLEKKTYAVITFADFGRAMQKMSEKMGQKNQDAQVQFKADVKQTGATKSINGFQTKETVLTLAIEGQDQKSGNKGAMNIVTDMWLAPNLPGYEEVKQFYARMAQKLAFAPGMGGLGGMMGQQAGMAKGMSELYKEASKIDGVPVLQVIRMGGTMEGMSEADMARMQQEQALAATASSASDCGRCSGIRGNQRSRQQNGQAGRIGWRTRRRFGRFRPEEEGTGTTRGTGAAADSASGRGSSGTERRRRDASGNTHGTDDGTDGVLIGSCRYGEDVRARRLQAGGTRHV